MVFESFVTFMNKIMLFSSYVNNAYGFPQPLTAEEEKKYLALFWEGDENAKEKLINHNLRLVAHIVKKYSNSTSEAEDMISVGSIGLIKAVNTYSPDRGTQLSTYAARCIENEILMLLRSAKKHKGVSSLNETLGKDNEGNEISLMDVVGSDENELINSVETSILTQKLVELIKKSLSPREYEIIKLRYGMGGCPALTQREVAKELGISRSYISRLEKKALQIINEEAKGNELFC